MKTLNFFIKRTGYRLIELESKFSKQLIKISQELEVNPNDPYNVINNMIKKDQETKNYYKDHSELFLNNFEKFMNKLLQRDKVVSKESVRNYVKKSDFETDNFINNEYKAWIKLQQMGILEATSETDLILK